MKYKQVTVKVSHDETELASYAMIESGSEGASVVDARDVRDIIRSKSNWDYYDESLDKIPDDHAFVTGCFAEDADIRPLIELLGSYLGREAEISVDICDSADWENEWKKYYSPIKTGKLVVVPEWINYAAKKGEKIVKMDPGQAFGTGEHESTRICLYLLQKEIKGGEEVIDVGCGSGILAAAAIVAGARHADACDIDPVAVEAAERNARLNGVEDSVRIVLGSLEECAEGKYDVILANITADVLIAMSNGFRDRLKEGGALIMSGVINSRAAQVEEAMKSAGFTLEEKQTEKEWTGYLWR